MTCAYTQMCHWLIELNSIYGTSLKLDNLGYCDVASESGIEFTLFSGEHAEQFRVYIDLLQMPHENQTNIYQKCLELNFDQGFTGGASIAIDAKEKRISLCFIREVEKTDFTEFSNLLQNLIAIAKDIKNILSSEEKNLQSVHSSIPHLSLLV